MANQSIYTAFQRMWEHVGLAVSTSLATHNQDSEAHSGLITVKYEGDKLYGLVNGAWQELVIKSQPTRASVQIAADGTSVITIPESITSLECVDVYQNGLYLSEGINYTLDTSARTVSLIDYTADANDVFAFVAY